MLHLPRLPLKNERRRSCLDGTTPPPRWQKGTLRAPLGVQGPDAALQAHHRRLLCYPNHHKSKGVQDSTGHGPWTSTFQHFKISTFQVSTFQDFNVEMLKMLSSFQHFNISTFQDSTFQDCKVEMLKMLSRFQQTHSLEFGHISRLKC